MCGLFYLPHAFFKINGFEGSVAAFAKMGFEPAAFWVLLVAIATELVCAVGLTLNLYTRYVGLASAGTMALAAYGTFATKGRALDVEFRRCRIYRILGRCVSGARASRVEGHSRQARPCRHGPCSRQPDKRHVVHGSRKPPVKNRRLSFVRPPIRHRLPQPQNSPRACILDKLKKKIRDCART